MMLLCLGASLAAAETITLSLDDAIDRAIKQNPELIQALASVDSARASLTQTWATFEPSMTASYTHSNSAEQFFLQGFNVFADLTSTSDNYSVGLSGFAPTGTSYNINLSGTDQFSTSDLDIFGDGENELQNTSARAGITINQSLLQGFWTTYNLNGVRTARRSLTSSEAAAYAQRQQVLADTANAYWNLYYQRKLVEISRETLEVTREERRIVIARIEQGDLAPVERSRVEAATLEAESSLLTAQGSAATAAESLLLLLGESPADEVIITSAPSATSGGPLDTDAAISEAMEQNADLLQLRQAEQTAEDSLATNRRALLPELTGTASYQQTGNEEGPLSDSIREALSGDFRNWSLGATLSVPLGNRADRGAADMSAAELTRAREARAAYERTLEQQVRAQVRAVQLAQLQIDIASANLVAAEETLAADRALRDAGRAIEKDVLESIRDVENARVAAEQALADYNLALIELNRLRGAL